MCGRYVSTSSLEELAEAYIVDEVKAEPLPERYNVAPTQPVYAVATRRPHTDGEAARRQLGVFRWGLVPSWAKDLSVGSKMINARAESIATKPAFRRALVRRRCVIPADAFWEWQAQPPPAGGGKPRSRLPHVIRHRDRSLLSLAGIWEVWRDPADPDADPVRSAAIVTTTANAALGDIHQRMPVVLGPDAVGTWLDPAVEDVERLQALLVPAPDDGWEVYPVSSRVNAVTNEGPELLEPLPA
jgi:putative SOS response-associated peptidase YedK